MTAIPPMFWKRVTLAHSARRSVLLWPLMLLASLWITTGTARFVSATLWGPPPTARLTPLPGGAWKMTAPTVAEATVDRLTEAYGLPWFPVHVLRWSSTDAWRAARETWAAPLAVMAGALMTGLTLTTLTTSRRICGVRGVHILRACVYRIAPIVALYMLWCFAQALNSGSTRLVARGEEAQWWTLMLLAITSWGVWWWGAAFAHGWQMRRPWLLTALMSVIDLLAAAAAYASLSPSTAGHLLFGA